MQLGLTVVIRNFLDKQFKLVAITGRKEQNLHVHLVRSRFGLFLWKAAQHDGSDGPVKDTRRIRE